LRRKWICHAAHIKCLRLGLTTVTFFTIIGDCTSRETIMFRRLALAVILTAACAANAAQIDRSVDATKMGSLDQSLTNCQNSGCGPTAAVNSFVFLQNMYGSIYGTNLVPAPKAGDPPNKNLADVANTLLGANYMNTDCVGCGTDFRDFILGKQKYIEEKSPGKTVYMALVNDIWALPGGPTKPDYVRERTAPTIDFLSTELADKEDVELLIKFADGSGHYVTLTGLKWNSDTKLGTLTFVDPDGGVGRDSNISQSGDDPLHIDLQGADGNARAGTIFAAVSESPILTPVSPSLPEPETYAMLLAGLGLMGFAGRRRKQKSS